MKRRWQTAAAIALIGGGVLLALWPLSQFLLAQQAQRELRDQWMAQASAAPSGNASSSGAAAKSKNKNGRVARPKAAPAMTRWEPVRLIINAMDLDAIVVQGVSNRALRKGPGHDPHSALPGQKGNCVIAAHRNAYGWWFYRLNRLRRGDLVTLQTHRIRYSYRVASTIIVHRRNTGVLQSWPNAPRLTLYSCTLPKTENRIVVSADYIGSHWLSSP